LFKKKRYTVSERYKNKATNILVGSDKARKCVHSFIHSYISSTKKAIDDIHAYAWSEWTFPVSYKHYYWDDNIIKAFIHQTVLEKETRTHWAWSMDGSDPRLRAVRWN